MADINIRKERCEQCSMIPIVDIHTPQEYILCVGSLARTALDGDVEIVFQNCPIDQLMSKDEDKIWSKEKFFHQFRCTKCGTIYGMLFNTRTGGQIKINDKVFDPNDYPDPPRAEEGGK